MIKKIFIIFSLFSLCDASDMQFEILTGNKNNTYYQMGMDMATYIAPEMETKLEVKESKGSISNLTYFKKNINQKKVTLAIVQCDALKEYKSKYKNASKKLKIITELYGGEFHFIVRADSSMSYFNEIKGKRINVGLEKSGMALGTLSLYKDRFGVTLDNQYKLNFNDAIDNLYHKNLDVVAITAGQPIKRLELMTKEAEKYIKLLKYNSGSIDKQCYDKAVIDAKSYTWNSEDIPTLSIKAYLITYNYQDKKRKKILENFAKSFTKNLYKMKQLAHKNSVHKKWLSVPTNLAPLPKDLEYYETTKYIWDKNRVFICDDYQKAMGRCK